MQRKPASEGHSPSAGEGSPSPEAIRTLENFKLPSQQRKSPNSPLARQSRALKQRRFEKGESHIQVRRFDFGSHGVSSVIPNIAGERGAPQHDTLSELETTAVLQARALGARKVVTQYPLRLNDDDPDTPGARGTLSVAADMGFKHPSSEQQPLIMTCDVVVWTADQRVIPLFVRYEQDRPKSGSRQMQLFRIAQAYWQDRDSVLVTYTETFCTRAERDRLIWAADGAAAMAEEDPEFLLYLIDGRQRGSLSSLLSRWPLGLTDALIRFKHALAIGRVVMPLSQQLQTIHQPVSFKVRSDTQRNELLRSLDRREEQQ